MSKNISLFGYGKTTKAIADKINNCKIFDDNVDKITKKNGHWIYPSSMFDPNNSSLEITSPGIPPHNPIIKKAKNLMSDYDYFLSSKNNRSLPVQIWISGTNGKTTTTKMLQHLLKEKNSQMGGNVGIPLSQLDFNASMFILETSSFTLHYTNIAKPNIYILLPVSDDHASWHGTFEEYKKAKLKPLSSLKEGEVVILPEEFKNEKTNGFKITYKKGGDLAKYFNIDIKKINFKEPFLIDAILALGVTKILFDEIDYDKINSFNIDPHRLEEIKDSKNRLWINDSKGTNVHATIQAVKRYQNKNIYLILGGDDKGANLMPLFNTLKQLNIIIYATGNNKEKIENLAKKIDKKVIKCDNLEEAIKNINKVLKKDEIALLSPAASSLDEYSSYKERGEIFKTLVQNI